MLMKVFDKGQVVIPAEIRHLLGIQAGDMLDVSLDQYGNSIVLKKKKTRKSRALAGSLASYAKNRPFPSKPEIIGALEKGLGRDADAH